MSQFYIKQLQADGSIQKFRVGRSKFINVLLVGRCQTGKSTIVETLINPQKGTYSSGFSDTRDSACNILILTDKITNLSYQLNLIDTPGLKESRQTGEISRSDDGILKLASFCVEEQITSLNIVCFVSRAGETHRLDIDVLNEVKKFLGYSYSSISMMVLTHCDEFPSEKLDEFEQSIQSHDVTKTFFDFCKLGIVRFGAINKDKIQSEEEILRSIVVESRLKKVEKMRDNFLHKVIECSDSAVKVLLLQRIYDVNLEVRKKEIKDALKKEKDQNSYVNLCKVQ